MFTCTESSIYYTFTLLIWATLVYRFRSNKQTTSFSEKALFQQLQQQTPFYSYFNNTEHSNRIQVLNWPACIHDLSAITNVWWITKYKIQEKLSSRYPTLSKNRKTTCFQNYKNWSQLPSAFRVSIKRLCRGVVNMTRSQLLKNVLLASNFKWG